MRSIEQPGLLIRLRERPFAFGNLIRQLRIRASFFCHLRGHAHYQSNGRSLVARFRIAKFRFRLHRTSLIRVFSSFNGVRFLLDHTKTVFTAPLARPLPRVVTVPRSSIRRATRTFIPDNGFLFVRHTVTVNARDFLVTFNRRTSVFKATNASFSLRCPCAYVRRLVRRVGYLGIFEQRGVLIFSVRFSVTIFVFCQVDAPAGLRTDSPINKDIRFIRTRMAFAKGNRARDSINGRFSASRFSFQSHGLLISSLPVSFVRLFRVRLAHRSSGVDGANVRFRYFHVKGIRLYKGVRLLSSTINVIRDYRVNHGSH